LKFYPQRKGKNSIGFSVAFRTIHPALSTNLAVKLFVPLWGSQRRCAHRWGYMLMLKHCTTQTPNLYS